MNRAGADDEPRGTAPGTKSIESVMRGGDDLGMSRQAQGVIRGKRHRARPVWEREVWSLSFQCERRAPTATLPDLTQLGVDPLAPTHASDLQTSEMASANASTIRSISEIVEVSMGIRTITSPRGRSNTPRSTAPAHTFLPHFMSTLGGASSIPPMRP